MTSEVRCLLYNSTLARDCDPVLKDSNFHIARLQC